MQTIKTAVVVVLLLTVLYGAYVAISDTGTPLPIEVAEWVESDPDLDVDFPILASTERSASPGIASLGSPRFVESSRTDGGTPTGGRLVAAAPTPPAWPGNATAPNAGPDRLSNDATTRPIATGRSTDRDAEGPERSDSMMSEPIGDPTFGWDAPPLSAQSDSRAQAAPAGRLSDAEGDWESALTPARDASAAHGTLSGGPQAPQSLAAAGSADRGHSSETWPDWLGDNSTGAAADNLADRRATQGGSLPGAESGEPRPSTPRPTDPQGNDSGFGNASGASDSYISPVGRSFENAKRSAMELIGRGELKQALATLSFFYSEPELTDRQLRDLIEILDPLAGEVIYSRGHYLGPAYRATPTDRLIDVAKKYDVPPEILAAINALPSIDAPLHGREMKVLPGPFRAELDLSRGELTMFLGELYAGRFPVSMGGDPEPRPGMYQVVEKQRNRNYYAEGGNLVAGEDPSNPYGGYWLDLGAGMCIHGSPADGKAERGELGCISLSPMDARDIFGMLGRGSKVLIRE